MYIYKRKTHENPWLPIRKMKATLFWWGFHIYSIVYWRVVLFLWHFGYLIWKMWNKYGYFGYYGRFSVTHGHNLALSRCVQAQKKKCLFILGYCGCAGCVIFTNLEPGMAGKLETSGSCKMQ